MRWVATASTMMAMELPQSGAKASSTSSARNDDTMAMAGGYVGVVNVGGMQQIICQQEGFVAEERCGPLCHCGPMLKKCVTAGPKKQKARQTASLPQTKIQVPPLLVLLPTTNTTMM